MGEKSTCILHAVNGGGMPCEEPIKLDCELLSEITGTKASCSIERRQSQYEVSYQAAHHEGETPATHQSRGTTHQRKSVQCSSETASGEIIWWGGEAQRGCSQPKGGGGGY